MAEIREAELETACDILGVERIYQLGYRDSGMPETERNKHPNAFWNADPEEAVGSWSRSSGPSGPRSCSPTTNRRATSTPTTSGCTSGGPRPFTEAGDPEGSRTPARRGRRQKLYYFATFTKKRMQMLHEAALAEGIESPFGGWLENWEEMGFEDPDGHAQVDVCGLHRAAQQGAARARDPDRPRQLLVRDPRRAATQGLSLGGLHPHRVDRRNGRPPERDLFEGSRPSALRPAVQCLFHAPMISSPISSSCSSRASRRASTRSRLCSSSVDDLVLAAVEDLVDLFLRRLVSEDLRDDVRC